MPLVPVTLALNEPPEDPEHDRVEVPVPDKLLGLRLQERLGELVTLASDTVPVKPLTYVTVIVESPDTPTAIGGTDVGLAVIEKSGLGAETCMVRVALVLTRVPDVALIWA